MRTTLLFSVLLCANVGLLQAQSDVTGQYLTNAGFDDSSSWAASDLGNGTLQSVTGWTSASTGDSWYYGGAIGYASGKKINSVTVSCDPDGATSGGALGLSVGWGCTAVYTQTATLPAGIYSLTYHYYNANSAAAQANNYCGVIEADGTTHYGTTTSFTAGSWQSETVSFTLTAQQTVTVSLGIGAISGGSGANAKLFIDKVVLTKDFLSSSGDWGGTGTYSAKWKGKTYTAVEKFQWANTLAVGEAISQTMTNLPAGKYNVEILAEASSTSGRDNTSYVLTDGSTQYVSLHANDASVSIPAYNRIAFTEFNHYILTAEVGESGTLKVSMNEDEAGPNWLVFKLLSCNLTTAADAATALDMDYKVGDVDCSGTVDAADVPVMAQMALGNTSANVRSHIINQDQVTVSDLTELQNVIAGKASYPEVHRLLDDVSIRAFVHAEQSAGENSSDASYLLVSARNKYAPSVNLLDYGYDWGKCFTQLNITTSLTNVKSVSVYSIDKASIAGGAAIHVTSGTPSLGVYTDNEAVTYASSTLSDVVTVTGDDAGTYTAYLLPAALPSGVIVTVRTSDGKYYSQTFTGLNIGAENNLSFTQTEASNAWMAAIPGNIPFTFLSLAGTHDAATSSITAALYQSRAQCQSMTIAEQLNAGIRSLDLRPYATSSSTSDNLEIYHGSLANTSVKFKDALSTICSFLDARPTETVFVLVHEEDGDDLDAWRSAVLTCLTNVSSYIKVIDGNMTLDDCRGKMVVIARDDVGSTNLCGKCGWGGSFADKTVLYGNSSGTSTGWTLMYQDEYGWDSSYKTNRIANMEKLLSTYISANETNANRIYYSSSNVEYSFGSTGSYIQTTAKAVNQTIVNSTTFQNSTGRWGIVSGDYMGDSDYYGDQVLKMIIDQNFKYVYKGRSRVNN